MKKSIVLCAVLFTALQLQAQGSADWSGSYAFPSVSRQQSNLSQADLIAKREAGYYDNIGQTTVYNISSTSIGAMSQDQITINGDGNNVSGIASNTGGLDSSVNVQSISLQQSTYSNEKRFGAQD
jgi:hypothetical protein